MFDVTTVIHAKEQVQTITNDGSRDRSHQSALDKGATRPLLRGRIGGNPRFERYLQVLLPY